MAIEMPETAIPTDVQLYNPEKFPTSRTGIGQGYIDQIMSSVVPQLTSAVGNYPANVDQYVGEATGLARSTGQDLLSGVLQTNLNSLVNRGMLGSQVAGDTLGNATGEILKNIQNQTMQAGMEGAKLKIGMPDMLGQLAGLGQVAETSDPSVPDRIIASLFAGTV
jgi:hypothetical protein